MYDPLEQSGVVQHVIREWSVEEVVVPNANGFNGAGSGVSHLNGACT